MHNKININNKLKVKKKKSLNKYKNTTTQNNCLPDCPYKQSTLPVAIPHANKIFKQITQCKASSIHTNTSQYHTYLTIHKSQITMHFFYFSYA